jgi:hypothetical protein
MILGTAIKLLEVPKDHELPKDSFVRHREFQEFNRRVVDLWWPTRASPRCPLI